MVQVTHATVDIGGKHVKSPLERYFEHDTQQLPSRHVVTVTTKPVVGECSYA